MTKRKGFTLVELLIVVVIIGVLSSMMSISSVSATDSAKASAILGNLATIKRATLAIYMESNDVANADDPARVLQGAAEYMGTTETAIKNASFDIVLGDNTGATPWYVYFDASTNKQNTNVKKILGEKAKEMNLVGAGASTGLSTAGIYDGTSNQLIGLRIR